MIPITAETLGVGAGLIVLVVLGYLSSRVAIPSLEESLGKGKVTTFDLVMYFLGSLVPNGVAAVAIGSIVYGIAHYRFNL